MMIKDNEIWNLYQNHYNYSYQASLDSNSYFILFSSACIFFVFHSDWILLKELKQSVQEYCTNTYQHKTQSKPRTKQSLNRNKIKTILVYHQRLAGDYLAKQSTSQLALIFTWTKIRIMHFFAWCFLLAYTCTSLALL